jgi:hypothetical protein
VVAGAEVAGAEVAGAVVERPGADDEPTTVVDYTINVIMRWEEWKRNVLKKLCCRRVEDLEWCS